ncbi:MAG: FAD-binding oxidoreductase [Candidatus Nanopelagicales bacterium]
MADAEVVVIGGGVVGCSIAFHLAEAGVDVVLLERDSLGAGSSSKAAGGVRAQFSDEVNVRLGQRSLDLLADFGRRPAHEIDLERVGYLFLLSRPEDIPVFERSVRLQNSLGVPSRLTTVAAALRLSPLVCGDGLLAAAYSPEDGHCTPEAVVQGYAIAARRLGARLVTGCEVTEIAHDHGDVARVVTSRGDVTAGVVVCAAGAWSRSVGAMVGVDLPVEPVRRQVVVTEPVDGLPAMPMTIDYATSFYFHREGRGLLIGMSDPAEPAGFDTHVDDDFLALLGSVIERRAPKLADVGIAHRWAGLYEVTPDHNALIGQDSTPIRFVYAAGFSGHGFLQAPAVGEVVRDLVLGRAPEIDVTALSAERFTQGRRRTEANVV